TMRAFRRQPGWGVCPAQPSCPDGWRCEFASRAVLRAVLAAMPDHDVLAALEYEVRLRDASGAPLSSGISYSLVEIGRYDAFVEALVPALEDLGVELSAVHTEAGPGLLELNLGARPCLRAA